MLIPVTAMMIHYAAYGCKRLVLKDGRPFHMVKFVGAVRNFSENVKNVMIDVEDGMGLVRVILWRKQNECMAGRGFIYECNGNGYICVIGEVKIIMVFTRWLLLMFARLLLAMKSHNIFWRWHIHLKRRWNMQKMRCCKMFLSNNLFANH
jgi:hypothetical protein